MPAQPLPEHYPTASASGPEQRELLRSYTCVACGSRHASWATFRTHRTTCSRRSPSGTPRDTNGIKSAEAPPEVGWRAGEAVVDDPVPGADVLGEGPEPVI